MLTRKLANEIARQLHGDILSYDWLLKIAEEQLVGKSFSEITLGNQLVALLCDTW